MAVDGHTETADLKVPAQRGYGPLIYNQHTHWTVDSAVARCAGRTPYSTADMRFACLGLFRHVLNGEPGIVLTDENVFAPAAIESFIASLVNFKAASRGNLRSVLYRMSEVLLGIMAKGNSAFILPSSDPSE